MNSPKICVVGSSNIDLVSYAPRLPKMGETLVGLDSRWVLVEKAQIRL